MDATTASGIWPPPAKKKNMKSPASIQSVSCDILHIIFSLLDFIDLIHCFAVCKSCSVSQERVSKMMLKELAMDRHRLSLQEGSIDIYQWKGHLVRVNKCWMKEGLVLTGGGDKVMRLAVYGLQKVTSVWMNISFQIEHQYMTDFDESKVVGLVGTCICIWRRNGKRNIFSSREGEISKVMWILKAIVGCEDGRAHFFDLYSRKWSKIVKINDGPVTCLAVSDDQMIVGGSSIGSIMVSDLSSDQRLATLRSFSTAGISTLCFNSGSPLLFSGSTARHASCWDLRMMRSLWQTRASPNVIYSMHHLRHYTSTLAVGGIDGVLRVVDQNTGEVLSRCILDSSSSESVRPETSNNVITRKRGKRITEDTRLNSTRPDAKNI